MKTLLFFVGTVAVLLASCATLQDNIDARKFLARCQYEYAGVSLKEVRFSSGILLDSVDLDTQLKITNPTDRDVALDHAVLGFYLDQNHLFDAAHKKFVRIAPSASSTETIAVHLPLGGIIKSLGHRPETITVKAKLWVTLLVGKETWKTPIVIPVEYEMPIPYDQIDAAIAKEKEKLVADAKNKGVKAANDLLKQLPKP